MTGTCTDCPDMFMTGKIWISKKHVQKVVSLGLIHLEERKKVIKYHSQYYMGYHTPFPLEQIVPEEIF